MSRSGYSDDADDNWSWIRYRGAVASAIRGKHGQAFLHKMIAVLEALPEKRLVPGELETKDGSVCALGAVGRARGINMHGVDAENIERVADLFKVPDSFAREIVYTNDEAFDRSSPEERFQKMLSWAKNQIWWARGCVADPYSKRALSLSKRLHWRCVIAWNEV